MARRGLRTYPSHIQPKGRGTRIDDASGFLRPDREVVRDVRQGMVHPDFADTTPGFGTYHPQDVRAVPVKPDPRPLVNPRPDPNPSFMSARDMGYTDAEVRDAIRENRPLRPKV